MTEQPRRLQPAHAAGAFHVEECDVPAEMTLGEWRRRCADERRACEAAARKGAVRRRLRRLLGA